MGVVPGFDELEDGHSGLGLGLEPSPIEQFTFQGSKEAPAQGIVEAVPDGSSGRPHIGILALFPEGDGCILASLIVMMDHRGGAALPQGHVQCLQHQFRPEVRCHRQSHDPAGKVIHHHGQGEENRPRGNVGDIRHPQSVWRGDKEVPLHQIRDHRRLPVADGRSYSFAAADALQCGFPHHSGYVFPPHPKLLPGQFERNPGHTVGLAGTPMNHPNPIRKRACPFRGQTLLSRMTSDGGDARQTAHRGNRIIILIRLHESVDLAGNEPVSRASQAAAFDKISRSLRSCRFPRWRGIRFFHSSLVRPSLRLPSSRSAWDTPCASTALWAQTLQLTLPGSSRLAPSRPGDAVTPADTVDGSLPCWTPLFKG